MSDPKTIVFFAFLFLGVMLVGLSLPLILNRVPPNPWYGLRMRQTLTDAGAWYAANRYCAWWMLGAALVFMVAATAGFLAPLGLVPYAVGCGALLIAALVAGIVLSLRYVRRLERAGEP